MKLTAALRSFLVGSSILATTASLHAADYYWDTNSTGAGFGTGPAVSPAGIWGTDAFWSTSSLGTGTTANTTIQLTDTVHFGTSTDGFNTAGQVTFSSGTKNAGNITFGSANSVAVVINNGTALNLAAASVITVNNTTGGGSIAGQISGAATSLTKEGAGTLSLSGNASNYTGATIINGGTINAQQLAYASSASSLGNAGNTADKLVLNGGTLNKFGTLSGTTARLFTLGANGGGLSNTGTVENMVFSSTGSIVATGAADRTLTLSGSFSTGTGNSLAPVLADASGGGKVSVIKNGANTWTLSGATNSYSGGTTVNNGTLTMGSASALGSTTAQLTVNGGTLDMAGNSLTVGNLTGSGGVISGTSGTRTLTIGQGNGTGGDFQGQINNGTGGTTALTKNGTGTITLSGSNGYSGATTVNNGTLRIDGSTSASSTVGVASSGTLGGTGTIGGAVNVTGQLSPGASIETLGTGTLSFLSTSTLVYELDSSVGTSVGSDLLNVTGNLNLTGTVNLNLTDIALTDVAFAANTVFSLINYTGTWNGGLFTLSGNELADEEVFSFGLNTWKISYNDATGGSNYAGEYAGGSDSFVNLTAIPEPGAALLGGLGMLALLRRRRI